MGETVKDNEKKDLKSRHQQDLNLRSQRETDIREIRICRLNHSAIVSWRLQPFYPETCVSHSVVPSSGGLPLSLHLNLGHESLSANADTAHLALKVGPPLH
jgi:hypothetical protein